MGIHSGSHLLVTLGNNWVWDIITSISQGLIIRVKDILVDAGTKKFLPLWRSKVWEVIKPGSNSGKVLIKNDMELWGNCTRVKVQAQRDSGGVLWTHAHIHLTAGSRAPPRKLLSI